MTERKPRHGTQEHKESKAQNEIDKLYSMLEIAISSLNETRSELRTQIASNNVFREQVTELAKSSITEMKKGVEIVEMTRALHNGLKDMISDIVDTNLDAVNREITLFETIDENLKSINKTNKNTGSAITEMLFSINSADEIDKAAFARGFESGWFARGDKLSTSIEKPVGPKAESASEPEKKKGDEGQDANKITLTRNALINLRDSMNRDS